jgi:hypothetical protein
VRSGGEVGEPRRRDGAGGSDGWRPGCVGGLRAREVDRGREGAHAANLYSSNEHGAASMQRAEQQRDRLGEPPSWRARQSAPWDSEARGGASWKRDSEQEASLKNSRERSRDAVRPRDSRAPPVEYPVNHGELWCRDRELERPRSSFRDPRDVAGPRGIGRDRNGDLRCSSMVVRPSSRQQMPGEVRARGDGKGRRSPEKLLSGRSGSLDHAMTGPDRCQHSGGSLAWSPWSPGSVTRNRYDLQST